MQLLGELAVVALVGLHGFGDQPPPHIEKARNSRGAARQSNDNAVVAAVSHSRQPTWT